VNGIVFKVLLDNSSGEDLIYWRLNYQKKNGMITEILIPEKIEHFVTFFSRISPHPATLISKSCCFDFECYDGRVKDWFRLEVFFLAVWKVTFPYKHVPFPVQYFHLTDDSPRQIQWSTTNLSEIWWSKKSWRLTLWYKGY